jgi:hypothetical protein
MEGYADLQTGMAETIQYQGDLQLNLERMTNFYFKFCSSHEAYYRLMMAMMYSIFTQKISLKNIKYSPHM